MDNKEKNSKINIWIKVFTLINGLLAIFAFFLTAYQIYSDKPDLKIKIMNNSCMISQIHENSSYGVYLEFQVYNSGKRSTGILDWRLQLKIDNRWQIEDGFKSFIVPPNLYFKDKFAIGLIITPFGYKALGLNLMNPSASQVQCRFNKIDLILEPGGFHDGYAFFPILTKKKLPDKIKARILISTPHKLYKSQEFLLNRATLDKLNNSINIPNISFEEFKNDFDQRLVN